MQRFRFNARSRKPGESVAAYVAELRRLAEFCEYGDSLEKMIRDRLVSGINDDNIQKKLLSAEASLTYRRALEIARGVEEAEKNLREMRAPRRERDSAGSQTVSKQEPVNQISGKQFKKPNVVCCFCCEAPGHSRVAECKYRDKTCRTCGKKGHLAKVCKSSVTRQPGNQKRQNPRHKQIRQVEDDASGESSDSLGGMS